MRLSNSYFYTLRENVKDEDSTSGNLLARAGYIKKTSSGVYMYLPLGYRVLKKIEKIIREEMIKSGSEEVLMPALVNEEFYVQSGRRELIGDSMFTLKDRFNRAFVLGPTHEELFALAASMKINSYKDLPFNLFQIQNKFRDELRPRFGLIRVREFMMKDAYSFDLDQEGLNNSYQKMYDAYIRSFDKMGLKYKIVKADGGIMGGLLSEEFQAITEIGEDTVVLCDNCDYASNLEIAEVIKKEQESVELKNKELLSTPNIKTIDDLANTLNIDRKQILKTLLYYIDGNLTACLIRGDQELNETKLRILSNAKEIRLANNEELAKADFPVGFVGPIGLSIPIIADQNILNMSNYLSGANQKDFHYLNTNNTDFKVESFGDIVNICTGDICPNCGGNIYLNKGIEIGNTFKLGTKYSKAMNLSYTDSDNSNKDVWMGSYGIGLGRCMAALVEQNHDENGLMWPVEIAPYRVAIVLISNTDQQQVTAANNLYQQMLANNIDVLFDDRNERAGVKFKDLELIGIPTRVVIGKHIADNKVEIRNRNESENRLIYLADVLDQIK
ncbi:MAG: proline--tRNA ligase [Erysipelotrichaceae bacterium]